MVTFKEQDMTIESSRSLQAMVNQAQDERVEMAARWSKGKQFTCGREIEDVE
jgi:hypothetical protein